MSGGRPVAIVVTPRLPWPVDDGGRVGLWQFVWTAAQDFQVLLVSLVEPGAGDSPPPEELRRLGVQVVRVTHRAPWTPRAVVAGLVGPLPYTLARFRSTALDDVLRRLAAEHRPWFVLANHLHLATTRPALPEVPFVLRQHNIEHRWLERVAVDLKHPLARRYARHQAMKMRRVEAELCARCDLVLAVHDEERDALRRMAPAAWVETVPVAIDLARYERRAPEEPPVVLVVGSFNRSVNESGARAFLEGGWPEVRRRCPGARLRVAGKGISASFAERIRESHGEPVGYVADIADEFSRAAVLVVPLWVGAGARVKIVEGLAAGVPVVATPMAAEGLGLEPGRNYLAGDSAGDLGRAAAAILADPPRAAALAAAGRAFASEHFSLAAVARSTNDLCRRAVERKPRRPEGAA